MSSRPEPSVNDLSPVLKPGVENEPMFLIDTTGSMTFEAAPGSKEDRRTVLREAMGAIVEKLASLDSQAATESQSAGEEAGGVMAYRFAGGEGEEIGDLRPDNWRKEWDKIRWGGGTQIMPGWNALVDGYLEEFGERPKEDRPHLLAVVFTDGEADDTDEFAHTLEQTKGGTYVVAAILGHGDEHDRALAQYKGIETNNSHVRVVTFGETTDPSVISDGVLSLLGVQ